MIAHSYAVFWSAMLCCRITSGANKYSVDLHCVHCCELWLWPLCSVHSCVVLCLVHPGVGSTKVRPRSLAVHCHTTSYVNQDHHHQSVQYCVQTEWFSCYESHLI